MPCAAKVESALRRYCSLLRPPEAQDPFAHQRGYRRRLVCLLEDPELERMKIADLVERARALGIDVLRLPIPEASIPRSDWTFSALVEDVLGRVRSAGRWSSIAEVASDARV